MKTYEALVHNVSKKQTPFGQISFLWYFRCGFKGNSERGVQLTQTWTKNIALPTHAHMSVSLCLRPTPKRFTTDNPQARSKQSFAETANTGSANCDQICSKLLQIHCNAGPSISQSCSNEWALFGPLWILSGILYVKFLAAMSTPNMTGRRIHRTMDAIPRRPWKSQSPICFQTY